MRILNLTANPASPAQVAAGVFEPKNKDVVQNLLTYQVWPTASEIADHAWHLSCIAGDHSATHALIDGPAFIIPSLVHELNLLGVEPIFAKDLQ